MYQCNSDSIFWFHAMSKGGSDSNSLRALDKGSSDNNSLHASRNMVKVKALIVKRDVRRPGKVLSRNLN
jgi:hypothetical protein